MVEVLDTISNSTELRAARSAADSAFIQYVEDEFFDAVSNVKRSEDASKLALMFNKIIGAIDKFKTDRTFVLNYHSIFSRDLFDKTYRMSLDKEGFAVPPEGYEVGGPHQTLQPCK